MIKLILLMTCQTILTINILFWMIVLFANLYNHRKFLNLVFYIITCGLFYIIFASSINTTFNTFSLLIYGIKVIFVVLVSVITLNFYVEDDDC